MPEKGLINFDPSCRGGTPALGINLESQDNLPLAYNKIEEYFVKIADRFIPQKKYQKELKISEIELYLAKMIGFSSVQEMKKELTLQEIETYLQEIKSKFDWSQNPLIGKRK